MDPPADSALFAYGTLALRPVMEAVTGRRFPYAEAVLEGYERFLLRGRSYPGIVESAGRTTEGGVYGGVDARAPALLDRFEDDFYERRRVSVTLRSGEVRRAYAYVIPLRARDLLTREPWDETAFMERDYEKYLADCHSFRLGL
jgi:gamma-glutamylcyclotransferase (GGCT)/AIG2-like uncharacterized protein YtfP